MFAPSPPLVDPREARPVASVADFVRLCEREKAAARRADAKLLAKHGEKKTLAELLAAPGGFFGRVGRLRDGCDTHPACVALFEMKKATFDVSPRSFYDNFDHAAFLLAVRLDLFAVSKTELLHVICTVRETTSSTLAVVVRCFESDPRALGSELAKKQRSALMSLCRTATIDAVRGDAFRLRMIAPLVRRLAICADAIRSEKIPAELYWYFVRGEPWEQSMKRADGILEVMREIASCGVHPDERAVVDAAEEAAPVNVVRWLIDRCDAFTDETSSALDEMARRHVRGDFLTCERETFRPMFTYRRGALTRDEARRVSRSLATRASAQALLGVFADAYRAAPTRASPFLEWIDADGDGAMFAAVAEYVVE